MSGLFYSLFREIHYIVTLSIIKGAGICSLYHEIHYIMTFLIDKGAGICSLYQEIHYIEIRYIEVWVYMKRHKHRFKI